ncbi:hypothetical protein CONCODRAFT_70007 [Conidiobolus coronatus NRRL 28638]|uniref:EF-hand n=1 Tax=Conidiobolus coronatus (strain ATCC 28846 / CBS 209.66 / NRRL 28638) TaxID=796925 RepID=A0A137P880_CONC2|nr:hypothetical protein CONCODRAFT_70007 [Conidiobolus coronatus NRRL 28638]|eukprot:KXN71216.1 hypothetical protein CONCODRAFT_70007 [Conidiobolus coronatus NRRL 28638]
MSSSSPTAQLNQFQIWFQSLNPVEGRLNADKVAPFLRKSNLPQGVLADIWELCDSDGEGFLIQSTFNLCMKLLVVAQQGQQPTLAVLDSEISDLPVLEGITPPKPKTVEQPVTQAINPQVYQIQPQLKQNYLNQFQNLNPINGQVSGDQVKYLFIQSELNTELLAQIWNLSDPNDKGQLNATEFCIALHLVHLLKSKQITKLPGQLPKELIQSGQVTQQLQPTPIPQKQQPPKVQTPVVPPLPADLDYYGTPGQLKLNQLKTELNQVKMNLEMEEQKVLELEKTLGLEEISYEHYSQNLNNVKGQIDQIKNNSVQLNDSISLYQENIKQLTSEVEVLTEELNASEGNLEKLRLNHRMEEGFMSINKTSFETIAHEVNSLRQALNMEPIGDTLDEWELFNPYNNQQSQSPVNHQQKPQAEPISPKSPFDDVDELELNQSNSTQHSAKPEALRNVLTPTQTESPAALDESGMKFDDFFSAPVVNDSNKPKPPAAAAGNAPILRGGLSGTGSVSGGTTRSTRKKDGKPRTILNFDFAKQ